MHTVTKHYRDLPAAHRQHNHDGHCRWVHGHNWGWDITFGCSKLDENGFVIDVGKLGAVKEFLTKHFDHTLLINGDDPQLPLFKQMDADRLIDLVVVDNCGMEALAQFVHLHVGSLLSTARGVHVVKVTCWEDSKNCATYRK